MTRRGFTLVEMLVSVALVVLIMTLFAEAFSIAASSIRKQRGIAENDQRVRAVVVTLLGDLQKRTYRQREDAVTETIPRPADLDDLSDPIQFQRFVLNRIENRANRLGLGIVPLHPDYFIGGGDTTMIGGQAGEVWQDGASLRNVDSVYERGYFYYSEGDIPNDVDDVLKFTINVSQTDLGNTDTTRLLGRAVPLGRTWQPPPANTPTNLNQPIWDDGVGYKINPDGTYRGFRPGESGSTSSDLAEIAYFVRDGKLYRRIHLIRQPLGTEANPDQSGQPLRVFPVPPPPATSVPFTALNITLGGDLLYGRHPGPGPNVDFGGTDFWLDFDHGATRFADAASGSSIIHLTDEASLDNSIGGDVTPGGTAGQPLPPLSRYWALGDPRNRFGHDASFYQPDNGFLTGRPKEYMDPTVRASFIGLYTHEETSHPNFDYPGRPTYNGGTVSPFAYGTDPPSVGLFNGGPRLGEDILLGNCHAFDVKVWDDQLGAFVDMGHTLTTSGGARGDWHNAAVADASVPPNPSPGVDGVGRYQAPHWPTGIGGMRHYGGRDASLGNRVFDTWHPAFNFSANTKDGPVGPLVERPDDDPPPHRPLWSDRTNFFGSGSTPTNPIESEGPVVGLAAPPGANPSGIRYWQADTDYPFGARVFPRPNIVNNGNEPMPTHQSFFYQLDLSQSVDADDDGFFTSPDGALVSQPEWPEAPGARTLPQTNLTTGDVTVWKAINNTIGLKAIQISVRFLDPTSGQMRQMTLTHSFVEQ